jgi:hypothetical protein
VKKILYIGLGLIGTLVVLLLLAPLFISVDQFRPKIVQVAESKLRAKVELGTLKLRLFPNFKVSSESLTVTPRAESGFAAPVLKSQSMSFEASLLSLLTSPSLAVHINQPAIAILSKNKKTNLEAILPEASPEGATPPPTEGGASPDAALSELPPWVRSRVEAASFSLFVKEAHLSYEDQDVASKTDLSKVDFSLEDIGLNQTMLAKFGAQVDFKGEGLSANGPIKAEMEIVSKTAANHVIELTMKGSKDLSGLELRMTNLFVKKAGIPFGASFAGKVNAGKVIDVDFSAIGLEFGTLTIKGHLKASDVTSASASTVDLSLKSNALNLADLKSYSPLVADYKLLGKADFAADVKGPRANPALNVTLSASGVQGSSPELATPINNLSADVRIGGTLEEPVVDIRKVQAAIGKASDIGLRGSIRGIKSPVVDLAIDSKNLDLDEIMGTPNNSKGGTAAGKSATEAVSTLPLDESLSQMAPTIDESLKNPMLDTLKAKVQTKFSKVKFMGAEYLDAGLLVTVQNRNLNLSKTSLRAYKGVIALAGEMKLVPVQTEFKFSTNLSNIAMADVVKAHAPDWVGALSGSALGLFEISGQGFTKAQLQKNLRGTVRGEIKDGRTNLAVVKVVNQVLDAVPKELSSALSSQAKSTTKNQYIEGDFETMKLDANIVGRKVNLKTFDTVFKSAQEKFGKFRFAADGFVTFDQDVDMTGTAFFSPDIVRITQLKGKSGQVEVPLKFGGKMYEPKVDVMYSVKRITETAGKAVLKEQGKKAVEKLLPALEKKAPKAIQKDLKKGLKKLFK